MKCEILDSREDYQTKDLKQTSEKEKENKNKTAFEKQNTET